MPVYKSPTVINNANPKLMNVFLAGSIEMNKAIDWQLICEQELENNFNVFNPRREQWDSSWKQSIDSPNFKAQVLWELNALEKADKIIIYFASNTKSPISLLEFGLYAKSNKLMVVCEEDFWRKGNIDIVCEKYDILQYNTLHDAIKELKGKTL
ncbi:nucleoside 2-deoxyribosyltransferase domain-containing protein [uncultured Lacinutrix sp.]|uniref:nucleoside 2-deoxyribosyltransferase domain-containing protein n=1 Tax=uncultured Lacinutrix sp. TaxID=574032 RepID=UPI00262CC229|nr:nucleoside 2-deoxyribosyltransferase domain-containing protein [uncultured Lacinutrix sp.]